MSGSLLDRFSNMGLIATKNKGKNIFDLLYIIYCPFPVVLPNGMVVYLWRIGISYDDLYSRFHHHISRYPALEILSILYRRMDIETDNGSNQRLFHEWILHQIVANSLNNDNIPSFSLRGNDSTICVRNQKNSIYAFKKKE